MGTWTTRSAGRGYSHRAASSLGFLETQLWARPRGFFFLSPFSLVQRLLHLLFLLLFLILFLFFLLVSFFFLLSFLLSFLFSFLPPSLPPFSFWQTPSCNTIHTADPFLLTWGSWLAEPLSFWQNPLMENNTYSRSFSTNLGIMAGRTLVFLAEPPDVTKYIQQILFYQLGDHGWQNPCLSGRTP